jgi:hypothetical protein
MKRLFGKRRATRYFPGEPQAQPMCRLGALVFQLDNMKKLYWASLPGCDPDSRMCVGINSTRTAGKTFSPKSANQLEIIYELLFEAIPKRQDMAPVKAVKVLLATCPRALLRSTLTALTSAKRRRLGIASNKYASEERTMN